MPYLRLYSVTAASRVCDCDLSFALHAACASCDRVLMGWMRSLDGRRGCRGEAGGVVSRPLVGRGRDSPKAADRMGC